MAAVSVPLSTPVRQRLAMLEAYALAGSRAPSIVALARELCRGQSGNPWWWLRAFAAVQSLPVRTDPPTVDVYTDAVQTLAQGGDCANKTALLAALYIAGRPYCGRNSVALVWEHCGSECAYDHVRAELYVDGVRWLLDPLRPGVSPGARSVPWVAREVIAGRWL